MPQALDEQHVRHIAHLARLKLTDEEVRRFAGQLSTILEYVASLNELDTSAIPPTAHALPICNVLRDDVVQPSLPVEVSLANAPQSRNGFFQVPKVLAQEDE